MIGIGSVPSVSVRMAKKNFFGGKIGVTTLAKIPGIKVTHFERLAVYVLCFIFYLIDGFRIMYNSREATYPDC